MNNRFALLSLPLLAALLLAPLATQAQADAQIANAINETLRPHGVAVIIQARHFCMCYRGVRQSGATTTTSKLHGSFLTNPASRMELFTLIGNTRD